jgi:hypothetical protein
LELSISVVPRMPLIFFLMRKTLFFFFGSFLGHGGGAGPHCSP